MIERKLQIGIFGTFDLENYGDLLFPLIAEAELSKRLGPITLHRFSYTNKTPPDWPYAVTSLAELPEAINGLDGVLIGGGHILRFDKEVAPGYAPSTPDIHEPTGNWLTPILMALQRGIPVAWNAPGAHGDVPPWADPLMELAVKGSRYICVRDQQSRQAVARFACDAKVPVVPDSAIGIARLVNTRAPSQDFTRLREARGLTGEYVIVQATPKLEAFARFLRSQPRPFRNYKLIVLPTGPVFGENEAVFGHGLPGAVRLNVWPNPLLLAELIAGASAVIGISLHLSLTALAFGVPLFRPADAFGGKHAVLLEHDGVFPFDDKGEIDSRQFAVGLGRKTPSPAVNAALCKLTDHWDTVADVFLNEAETSASTLRAINYLWQAMPALLENNAAASIGAPERDSQIRTPYKSRMSEDSGAASSFRQIETANEGRQEMIDLTRFVPQSLSTQPYEWAFVDGLFDPRDAAELVASYPCDNYKTVRGYDGEKGYEYEARSLIGMGASAASHAEILSPVWRRLADALLSPAYRQAVARLTGCDLDSMTMEANIFHYGPGAWLGPHVDLKDKVVTHVFYFNETWDSEDGGCLKILRSSDMHDEAASITPVVGNSVVIVRSEKSWHAVSPVVKGCALSRRSLALTFYSPGSVSTMWPPGDRTPLHAYGAMAGETSAWGATPLRTPLRSRLAALFRAAPKSKGDTQA